MTQLRFSPVYLLDACCVTRLDGKDKQPNQPPDFTPQERALIWQGLETIAKKGRLKLIRQVKEELKRWYPDGLRRLTAYPGHRLIIKHTPQTVQAYQNLARSYPNLRPKPGRDPADLWLVLVAQRYGYTIVTQEQDLNTRTGRRRDLRIPDVCSRETPPIPCLDLRGLANDEAWLS